MAETTTTPGMSSMSFIVGGLVVAVIVVGVFVYRGGYISGFGSKTTVEQTTTTPAPDGTSSTTTTTKTTP